MSRLLKQKLHNVGVWRTRSTFTHVQPILPEYSDVVIIGGGSAGCNALYHLGKRGVKAVLVEKSKLSSGTTWHTAGLVWCLRGPSDVEIELLKSTRRTLSNLEQETEVNPGWIKNGGMYIAHSNGRMGEYKRLVAACSAFGIEANLISPKEAKTWFPLLDDNTFKGAVHSPADGTVDPAMLLNSLINSAKKHECQVFEECPVNKILTVENEYGHKKVSGVETPYGIIKTNCVLNASGVWSRNLVKSIGLDIPLIPMKHAYIVTEHIKEIQGCPNIRAPDLNLYFKIQGGAMSIGGYESNPIILQSVPMDFSFSLYEMDWNVFDIHMKSMIQLMPQLSKTGIRTTVCGPESFTPDHRPIMGEDPRCTGLFYSCGYNSAGMMFGGGCGEQVAEWIINGRPDMHLFAYDIRRYIPEQRTNQVWMNERIHEAYAKNYNTFYNHDQPLAGRNLKKDQFHHLLLKEGAFMEEIQGWERPGWFVPDKIIQVEPYDYYGSYGLQTNENHAYSSILAQEYSFDFPHNYDQIKEEALSCRENVALFNISNSGKFYLCGSELELQKAISFIFTSYPNLNAKSIIYACALNHNGGVESYCTINPLEPGLSNLIDHTSKGKGLYIDGKSMYQSWAHMNKIIQEENFKVTLHNVTELIGILSVQGPKSKQILHQLMKESNSPHVSFEYLSSNLVTIDGEMVCINRLSTVGEFGFELHIPKQSCEKIYQLVRKCGSKYNMKLAGYRALSSLNCEKGYHEWGYDLRTDDNPLEANLDVFSSNAEYLGKESIDRCQKNGLQKKRVHVHLKERIPIWGLETIYRNGVIVGYFRKAVYSYYFATSIGLAYIQHPTNDCITDEFLQSGVYEVGIMGDKYSAQLHLHSPYDPQNVKLLDS